MASVSSFFLFFCHWVNVERDHSQRETPTLPVLPIRYKSPLISTRGPTSGHTLMSHPQLYIVFHWRRWAPLASRSVASFHLKLSCFLEHTSGTSRTTAGLSLNINSDWTWSQQPFAVSCTQCSPVHVPSPHMRSTDPHGSVSKHHHTSPAAVPHCSALCMSA